MEPVEAEARIRFRSSNFIADNTGTATIGDYAVEQTPSTNNSEGILTFRVKFDAPDKDMFFNMVRLEATYFLSFLSLVSQSDCEFQAGLWNLQNISTEEIKYFLTRRQFDFNEVSEAFQRLRALGDDETRRFISACNRYRQAISEILRRRRLSI